MAKKTGVIGFRVLYIINSSAQPLMREESRLHLGQQGMKIESIFFFTPTPHPYHMQLRVHSCIFELLIPVF